MEPPFVKFSIPTHEECRRCGTGFRSGVRRVLEYPTPDRSAGHLDRGLFKSSSRSSLISTVDSGSQGPEQDVWTLGLRPLSHLFEHNYYPIKDNGRESGHKDPECVLFP